MAKTIINRRTKIFARQLGITSKKDDARSKIVRALPHLKTLNGVEIVFEAGQSISWRNVLDLPDNIHLTALGDVTINATGPSPFSRFIRATNNSRCEIHGRFLWDAQALVSQIFIEAADNAIVSIDGSSFTSSAADLTQQGPTGIRIGNGVGCVINDVKGDRIGNLVHWAGNINGGPSKGRQNRTRLDNPASTASVLKINHHTVGLSVHDIEQTPYSANVIGGHCITLQGESTANPSPTIKDLTIDRVRFAGREGVGWEKGVANGATGDMIAIRSADNWSVSDFILLHGGEFGIDAVHGAQNGYIGPGTGEALIEHNDAAAIVIGGGAKISDANGNQKLIQPARNVTVEEVEIHNVGIDNAQTPLGYSSISGIRVMNAIDCNVINNRIVGARGAPIYITNNPALPVERLTVSGNRSRSSGTTELGGDTVWFGQTPAFKWNGSELSRGKGKPTLSNVTGLLNNEPFPAGTGGL